MLKLKAFIYIVMLNGYNYWLKLSKSLFHRDISSSIGIHKKCIYLEIKCEIITI